MSHNQKGYIPLKHLKGMTLVEVLVSSTIVVLVLSLVFGVLIYTMKYFHSVDSYVEVQQNCMNGIISVVEEMRETRSHSLLIETNPPGIILPSMKNPDSGNYRFDAGNGKAYWQRWVCIYLADQPDGTKNLVVKETAINPPRLKDPGTPPFATVSAFARAELPEKTIARNIEQFSVTGGANQGRYTISLTSATGNTTASTCRFNNRTEIFIRN